MPRFTLTGMDIYHLKLLAGASPTVTILPQASSFSWISLLLFPRPFPTEDLWKQEHKALEGACGCEEKQGCCVVENAGCTFLF